MIFIDCFCKKKKEEEETHLQKLHLEWSQDISAHGDVIKKMTSSGESRRLIKLEKDECGFKGAYIKCNKADGQIYELCFQMFDGHVRGQPSIPRLKVGGALPAPNPQLVILFCCFFLIHHPFCCITKKHQKKKK